MADPITPNTPNVDGQVITIACTFTSTGATKEDTVTLPTYVPRIDIRVNHPVLSVYYHASDSDTPSNSEILTPSNEMARGTAADSAGEWRVSDINSIKIYHTADKDGAVFITYIAFGAQEA